MLHSSYSRAIYIGESGGVPKFPGLLQLSLANIPVKGDMFIFRID
jgi:hypothetical protein